MKNLSLTISALALAGFSTGAFAVELPADKPNHFEYDYIDIAYVDLEDGLNGFSLLGSYDIAHNVALTGQFLTASTEKGGIDLDYDLLSIGLAYHFKSASMTDTDVVFHGELVKADYDASAGSARASDDESGIRVGAKLRMDLQPGVEVFGDISLTSADEAGDSEILITPGVAYEFADGLAGFISYEFSDREWLSLGLRYYY